VAAPPEPSTLSTHVAVAGGMAASHTQGLDSILNAVTRRHRCPYAALSALEIGLWLGDPVRGGRRALVTSTGTVPWALGAGTGFEVRLQDDGAEPIEGAVLGDPNRARGGA
jgi:hypothetical protein